jgi:AAA domain
MTLMDQGSNGSEQDRHSESNVAQKGSSVKSVNSDRNREVREAYDKIRQMPAAREEGGLLSVLKLASEEINWSQNLLGWRWLERGFGNLVIAPSGVGKSVWDLQAAVEWACGRSAFGIRCEGALRQIIFQHEDGRNDMIEMSRVVGHLGLGETERKMVGRNLRIIRLVGVQGGKAIAAMRYWMEKFSGVDLIHINPLPIYMGGGFQEEDATVEFLYHQISPLLGEFCCGCLGILHTPKTIGKSYGDLTLTERQYLASGRANWTNWGRGLLDIMPLDEVLRTYTIIASKRSNRIGWETPSTVWKWAPDDKREKEKTLIWHPASEQESFDAVRRTRVTPIHLLLWVPTDPAFTTTREVYEKVNANRTGNNRIKEDNVREMLESLVTEKVIIRTDYQLPQGGKKQVRYSQKG